MSPASGAGEILLTCSCRTVYLNQVPKAPAVNDTRGVVKIVRNHIHDQIEGVQICAPLAADMIHEATLAVKCGGGTSLISMISSSASATETATVLAEVHALFAEAMDQGIVLIPPAESEPIGHRIPSSLACLGVECFAVVPQQTQLCIHRTDTLLVWCVEVGAVDFTLPKTEEYVV